MEYMAEKIEDVKATVDKLDGKIDKFIDATNKEFVHRGELDNIKSDVNTLKGWALKFAGIVLVAVLVAALKLVIAQ